uniref:VWFA domain-containing protein n=1 Tax=Rhabditophanes sp. KR3021 TaxID=114890 RepID=A0AC35U2I7_9BILA
MKLVYSYLLFAALVGQVSAACKCTTFLKPTLISQYDYSVLYYPRDNITSMPCNPVKCIYTLEINEKDHGIGGNIYYVRNFVKSKASLKFYNGRDIAATPYFQLDENTKNSDLTVTHPSYDQFITMVLEVDPAVVKDFPTFIYYPTGSKQGSTTTTTTTTTTPVPTTRTTRVSTTTTQVPETTSITTAELPIILHSPIASDPVLLPKYQLEGDLVLLLDINSTNIVRLAKIAQNLINSIDITPFIDSENVRVNLVLYNNGAILPYGWNLDQESLNLITGDLLKQFENEFNAFNIISLGPFLSTVFEESKVLRKNVQRVAIFVTDNEHVKHLKTFNDETFVLTDLFDSDDIHPVFVNFNGNVDAERVYASSNIQFTGTASNAVVYHDYTNTSNLLESVLLNGNVLCNADRLITTSNHQVSIPNNELNFKKRYCNNMNVVTYCDIIDLAQPITVFFEQFDIEPQQDTVSVFDGKYILQNLISGHKIDQLKVTVLNSSLVRVVFNTGSSKVFGGGNYHFGNCIIRA